MRSFAIRLLGVCGAMVCLACGSSDNGSDDDDDDNADGGTPGIEIPAEFDAAFVTGEVCMPSQIHTGDQTEYPVRFTTCVYRCVTVTTTRINASWSCGTGLCSMILLATGHVKRVTGEENCDALQLPDPSPSECTPQTFEWTLAPPSSTAGEYPTGLFRVAVPYMTMAEGQLLLTKVSSGVPEDQAVLQVLGAQNIPSRQFNVEFQTDYAVVPNAAALSASDCHDMNAP